MTADEFAERLRVLAPSVSALMALGLNAREAEEFRARYECRRVGRVEVADPLWDLCSNFDVSSLEIGTVTLEKPSEFRDEYWKIGMFETDTLVVSKRTGEVSALDHEDLRRVLGKCARTGEGFLAALMVVAEFNWRGLLESELESDGKAGDEAFDRCVLYAGEECRSFYVVMLGESDGEHET